MSHRTTSGESSRALLQPARPVVRHVDLVPRHLQDEAQALGGVRIVLDHEDAPG